MNKITRRHCRKCRLEKCFAIGMKREWVRFEDKRVDEGKDKEPVPGTSGYIGTKPHHISHSSESADEDDAGGNSEGKKLSAVFDNLLDDQTLHGLLEDLDEQTVSLISIQ